MVVVVDGVAGELAGGAGAGVVELVLGLGDVLTVEGGLESDLAAGAAVTEEAASGAAGLTVVSLLELVDEATVSTFGAGGAAAAGVSALAGSLRGTAD